MVKYFIFIKIRKKLSKGEDTVADRSQLIRQIFPQMWNPVKKKCSLKKFSFSCIGTRVSITFEGHSTTTCEVPPKLYMSFEICNNNSISAETSNPKLMSSNSKTGKLFMLMQNGNNLLYFEYYLASECNGVHISEVIINPTYLCTCLRLFKI